MFPKGDPDFPLTKQKNINCPSKVTYYLQHSLFLPSFCVSYDIIHSEKSIHTIPFFSFFDK